MIIGLDFDGTVVEHDFPYIGAMKEDADIYLRKMVDDGHRIILWTCRENSYLIQAIQFMKDIGVEIVSANENDPQTHFGPSRKILCDVFIDDRNLGGIPETWKEIYELVKKEDELRKARQFFS